MRKKPRNWHDELNVIPLIIICALRYLKIKEAKQLYVSEWIKCMRWMFKSSKTCLTNVAFVVALSFFARLDGLIKVWVFAYLVGKIDICKF